MIFFFFFFVRGPFCPSPVVVGSQRQEFHNFGRPPRYVRRRRLQYIGSSSVSEMPIRSITHHNIIEYINTRARHRRRMTCPPARDNPLRENIIVGNTYVLLLQYDFLTTTTPIRIHTIIQKHWHADEQLFNFWMMITHSLHRSSLYRILTPCSTLILCARDRDVIDYFSIVLVVVNYLIVYNLCAFRIYTSRRGAYRLFPSAIGFYAIRTFNLLSDKYIYVPSEHNIQKRQTVTMIFVFFFFI